MSRRLAGLGAVMRALNLDMRGFSHRLLTQKTIYLLQVMGVDLGYRYNWYLKGPYSPALSSDAFEIEQLGSLGNVRLKPRVLEDINVIESLLSKHDKAGMDKTHWSELLVSLHYLLHISPNTTTKEKGEVIAALVNQKSYFTPCQAAVAWDELDELGLISHVKATTN